jgi:acyl carrier protein
MTTAPPDDALLDGVRAVARQHLAYEGPLTTDTVLVDALDLDSVRLLTLVAELENHFAVCLEEGDEAGLETVGDLVAVLRRRMEAAGG